MLDHRGGLNLASALLLALACTFTGADATTLTSVELRQDSDAAREDVVLTFEPAVPDIDVRNEPSGIRVSIPSTTTAVVVDPPLVLSGSEGGVELVLGRAGATLDGLVLQGTTVTLRVTRGVLTDEAARYQLGIGDIVTVSVYREPDLSGDFPVLQDGAILMPLIGAVPAAGTDVSDLAVRIRTMLSDYLVDPQVRAGVKEYQSQFVVITGAVAVASRVALRPGMTLKAVLSEAGVALGGGQSAILTRTGGDAIELSIADLDRPDAPLPRDGDVLTIQDPDTFFVSGEVRRPGRYSFVPGLTLQQALVLAEGLTEWASKKGIRIQRQADGETVDEVVNLQKIQDRKIPDPELRPGDLIVVRRRIM
jgi:polysaccharide export outer membrane protein